jgi:hypothetical protein
MGADVKVLRFEAFASGQPSFTLVIDNAQLLRPDDAAMFRRFILLTLDEIDQTAKENADE